MKLAAPFIQLPLLFDAEAMSAEVLAIDESCWMPHPQGFPGNSMLPLLAIDGDPANESYQGNMLPTHFLEQCPYLQQVLESLGATLGRTRLMRLSGNAEVTRHADQGYYWADRVRVHVPIVTQPTVRFECDQVEVNMAPGECWIFDTWRQHSVHNDSERSRIHLVVDTVGGDRFWSLVAHGRNYQRQPFGAPWQPETILPLADASPRLMLETANIPKVMTPWEVTSRIGFLIAEAQPHPNLQPIRQVAARFTRHWQALWAQFGEREEGWPEYRRAIDLFMQQIRELGSQILLRNELTFASTMFTLVAKVAVMRDAEHHAATATPSALHATPARPRARDPQFERPIIVVSSPRSGSTMLFEAMMRAPQAHTIGAESHAVIEGIEALSPARNGLGSNRLTAAEATPQIVAELRQRFFAQLRDREGRPPSNLPVRMVEKTPKNSLRVPFLAEVFPEAEFVYLHRDTPSVLGSMIDAWESGRFRTYPNLPGWQGTPWSLLLTPGWERLIGRPLAEIVAEQWSTALQLLVQDLVAIPPERVHVVHYADIVAQPNEVVGSLCRKLGLGWDQRVADLPLSRFTLSAPDKEKWRRHEGALAPHLQRLRSVIDEVEAFANSERFALDSARAA